MSDHTNRDIYFKTDHILPHVGTNDEASKDPRYINDQLSLINKNKQLLPPRVIYPNMSANPLNNNQGNSDYRGNFQNVRNIIQSASGIRNQGNIQNVRMEEPPNSGRTVNTGTRLSTYEPLKHDRYDPYIGFMHEKGVLEDNGVIRHVSTYININSAHRSTKPSNEINEVFDLDKNPLIFTEDSQELIILQEDHPFVVNDRITLTNVSTQTIPIRSITKINGIDVLGLRMDASLSEHGNLTDFRNILEIYYTHGIPSSYVTDNIQVQLSGVIGSDKNRPGTHFESFPVAIINTTHIVKVRITTTDSSGNTCPATDTSGNQIFQYNPNVFYIELPRSFTDTSGGMSLWDPGVIPYTFKLKFLALGGVPLNLINADYPIDINHLQGYHTITRVSSTGFTVQMKQQSLFDQNQTGGCYVKVGQISRITDAYPNPNDYEMNLGDIFHNVIAARLVSSEFPNTRLVIRNFPIEQTNNKLYWNNLDDGEELYVLEIEPGNYTPAELATELEAKFFDTKRVNFENDVINDNIPDYTNHHFVRVDINTSTSIVKFTSFREAILAQPIIEINGFSPPSETIPTLTLTSSGPVSIPPDTRFEMTIFHKSHGLETGSVILIQNAIAHVGISADILNVEFNIDRIIDENTYIIKLPKINISPISARENTGGGVAISLLSSNIFRLRFDQPDTIGDLLGFRNIGESLAITPYSFIITNKNSYENDLSVDALGNSISIRQNFLQLSGDDYVFLVTDKLANLRSTGPIKEAFSKIILCDIPGKTLYNSYVNAMRIRKKQLPVLSSLRFTFYAPDGSLFDFQGIDHSFTLEIITIEELPKGSNISAHSGRGNYQGTNFA